MENKTADKQQKKSSDFELAILHNQLSIALSSLRGFLSLTLEGHYGELPPKIKDALNKVEKNSVRMAEVLDLIFKLSAGKNIVPKVMLFEDDEFLAEVYRKKFEESGILVRAYTMPADNFLADILEYNPDLIITNIIMPKMDGIELTREIKADERTKKYAVMVFSSMGGEQETKQKAIQAGAIGCIAKSELSPEEFVAKVKGFLLKREADKGKEHNDTEKEKIEKL